MVVFVSATSIFTLPEIQLEKETMRPTAAAPDPGNSLCGKEAEPAWLPAGLVRH